MPSRTNRYRLSETDTERRARRTDPYSTQGRFNVLFDRVSSSPRLVKTDSEGEDDRNIPLNAFVRRRDGLLPSAG